MKLEVNDSVDCILSAELRAWAQVWRAGYRIVVPQSSLGDSILLAHIGL